MEVHALLRGTPILLAEQMLNEEMHDGQRRILILPQVKTKITEGNLIVRAGLGVCAEQKTCELYRKRLQVDDIAPHPVSSLPPLEFLGQDKLDRLPWADRSATVRPASRPVVMPL